MRRWFDLKPAPVNTGLKQLDRKVGQCVGKVYEVVSLENTTGYDIGQQVTKAHVDGMIQSGWRVKIDH